MSPCITAGCDQPKLPGMGRKYCAACKAAKTPASTPVCTISGCNDQYLAKGLCKNHYEHARAWGTPHPRTDRDRFEEKVDRNGPEFAALGRCWLWMGTGTRTGYGQLSIQGQHRYAHRWAYEHFVGQIPDGLQIDHLCRQRGCVNPNHLEPVTALENTQRAAEAITHCPQGHLYDERNTRYSNGTRQCRACGRAYYHKRTALH